MNRRSCAKRLCSGSGLSPFGLFRGVAQQASGRRVALGPRVGPPLCPGQAGAGLCFLPQNFLGTTTGFGQKTHFWTKKNMASETLIFFLFGVFFCHVKPISYESIFWRSYGVRSVPFWSICRVWGKISLRGHQNQLHGYIVLQST